MKSPLSSAILLLFILSEGRASALDTFACVRDLLPITEPAAFQSKRDHVERPFLLNEKYLVFPEVADKVVTGFYIYTADNAWYFDGLEGKAQPSIRQALRLFKPGDHTLYEMIAQPTGLETITLLYMPGYGIEDTTKRGPVALGASFLPVIGGMMSRTNQNLISVYHNPADAHESELQQWVYEHSSRKPASVKEIEVPRKMMQLITLQPKKSELLLSPLKNEYKLRKRWVQTHNLDEGSFRTLSRLMQTTCQE